MGSVTNKLPFSVKPFDTYVQDELKERKLNRDLDKPEFNKSYKGPYSAWGRVTSLTSDGFYRGFILTPIYGFEDIYGFQPGDNHSVIGYDLDNKQHKIKYSNPLITLKHRPGPSLDGLDVDMNGGAGKFRQVVIQWKCYSIDQLQYMEKYFLTPAVSVIVEYGWNHYNPDSNILNNPKIEKLIEFFKSDDPIINAIEKSKGRYDIVTGTTTKYNYSVNDDGSYSCSTTIASTSQFLNGLSPKNQQFLDKEKKNFQKKISEQIELGNFEKNLDYKNGVLKIKDLVDTELIHNSDFAKNSQGNVYYRLNEFFLYLSSLISSQNSSKNIKYSVVNIQNVPIRGHPNLKTGSANILLIPNRFAPFWQNTQDINIEDVSLNFKITDAEKLNKLLQNNINSIKRIDLDALLNKLRNIIGDSDDYNTHTDFPFYGKTGVPLIQNQNNSELNPGYFGKLGNLYVNADIIKNSFKTKDNLTACIKDILDRITGAVGNFWDFQVEAMENEHNIAISVHDNNFLSQFKPEYFDRVGYIFDFYKSESELISLNFNVELSSAVANQTMFDVGAPKQIHSGTSVSVEWFKNRKYFDLINGLGLQTLNVDVDPDIFKDDKEEAKATEKYAVIRTNKISNGQIIGKSDDLYYPLAEPDSDKLKAITSPENSPENVNNGKMPGFTVSLEILGISGIRYLDFFKIKGIMPLYSEQCIFLIQKVKHSIKDSKWTTSIEAGIVPYKKTNIEDISEFEIDVTEKQKNLDKLFQTEVSNIKQKQKDALLEEIKKLQSSDISEESLNKMKKLSDLRGKI
jgi:hypothetical protein